MSSLCENRETALRFAEYAASPIQTTLYTEKRRAARPTVKAWLTKSTNNMTMNFFKDTPEYSGPFLSPSPLQRLTLYFQDHAGDYIQDYIMNGGSPAHVL